MGGIFIQHHTRVETLELPVRAVEGFVVWIPRGKGDPEGFVLVLDVNSNATASAILQDTCRHVSVLLGEELSNGCGVGVVKLFKE